MAIVVFTQNLRRHVDVPDVEVAPGSVRSVLEAAFEGNERLRSYIVDEQGALRKHVTIFVDNQRIADRIGLSDAVGPDSEVYVLQALSGG